MKKIKNAKQRAVLSGTNSSLFEPSLNAAEEHSGSLYKRTIIVPDFPPYLFAYEAGKWSPHTHVHTRCPCVIGPPMTLVKSRCKWRLYFAQCVIISFTFIIFIFQLSSIQQHILLFFFYFFFFFSVEFSTPLAHIHPPVP